MSSLFSRGGKILVNRGGLANSCDCCRPQGPCCGRGERLSSVDFYPEVKFTAEIAAFNELHPNNAPVNDDYYFSGQALLRGLLRPGLNLQRCQASLQSVKRTEVVSVSNFPDPPTVYFDPLSDTAESQRAFVHQVELGLDANGVCSVYGWVETNPNDGVVVQSVSPSHRFADFFGLSWFWPINTYRNSSLEGTQFRKGFSVPYSPGRSSYIAKTYRFIWKRVNSSNTFQNGIARQSRIDNPYDFFDEEFVRPSDGFTYRYSAKFRFTFEIEVIPLT